MRLLSPRSLPLLLLLAGCSARWTVLDADGDGFSPSQGDCWDNPEGPTGTGLKGQDINPGAQEQWYDGIDQDCVGDDDYDADNDGFIPSIWAGLKTLGVMDSGNLEIGDCWDDFRETPQEFTVVSSELRDRTGQPIDWPQPAAADVHPLSPDPWYDGVDQDCMGDDDFDQDRDGWATDAYPNAQGVFGEDCLDGAALDKPSPTKKLPFDVHPDAEESWYDGTDDNCDGNDCDQDGDGYERDGATVFDPPLGFCPTEECDDSDPHAFPDASITEIWYDGTDDNCDGNEGDRDNDGYWVEDYAARVKANGGKPLPVPKGMEGDCDDNQPSVHPLADEYCDALDSDCDGETAEDDSLDSETWYRDSDRDGHGDPASPTQACVVPSGHVSSSDDCNDRDATAWPGASETCDGVDDDCDGAIDEGAIDMTTWYLDSDDDDWGVSTGTRTACTRPAGYAPESGDCDDTNDDINPGVAVDDRSDILVDNDCDGFSDEDSLSNYDIIFTEVSKSSTAGGVVGVRSVNANWIELYNTSSYSVSLSNWVLKVCRMTGAFDDPDSPSWDDCASTPGIAISPDAGLVIPSHGYVVLCQDATVFSDPTLCDYDYGDTSTWTGLSPELFNYSATSLNFSSEQGILRLRLDGEMIDEIGYYDPGWPEQSLRTMCLKPAYLSRTTHNTPSHWSYARGGTVYWANDPERNYGTPGAANATAVCY